MAICASRFVLFVIRLVFPEPTNTLAENEHADKFPGDHELPPAAISAGAYCSARSTILRQSGSEARKSLP